MRRRYVGLIGAAAVLAVSASLAGTSNASPDVAAATVALDRALNERQNVVVPSTTPSLRSLSDGSGVVRMTPDRQAAVRSHGREVLATLFDGPALTSETTRLDNALVQQSDASLVVAAGGADKVKVEKAARVGHGRVRLAGTVRTWYRIGQVRGDHILWATPSNVLKINATVGRKADWRVTSLTWSFAPGSEP